MVVVLCCFFLGEIDRNPGLVNQFSATPPGQPNWTGPSANSFERWFEFCLEIKSE